MSENKVATTTERLRLRHDGIAYTGPTYTDMLREQHRLKQEKKWLSLRHRGGTPRGVTESPPTTGHALISFQNGIMQQMHDAKVRHAERTKEADADEVEFSEQMLADEIIAIKAHYDRRIASYIQEDN